MALKSNDLIKANAFSYEDIKIGQVFSFEKFIDEKTVENFANLTGDYNPLHMDENYAKTTEFKGRIVHGMLLGSLFSSLVGMLCPGQRALYLSQDLRFKNPLKANTQVTVAGKVVNKFDTARIVELETLIKEGDKVIVEGLAKVKVRI